MMPTAPATVAVIMWLVPGVIGRDRRHARQRRERDGGQGDAGGVLFQDVPGRRVGAMVNLERVTKRK